MPIRISARLIVLTLIVATAPGFVFAAEEAAPMQLAIRCDDVGMCHSVNLAVRQLLAAGLPFSTSVMTTCPWFPEAAEILRANPQIGVGIHLTLNSEWEHYKWGPVLGAARVPSLVDAKGYLHASEADFAAADIDLDQVRAELEAQIERARSAGLRIDYLDYHMLTAVSSPELRAIVEELAAEYGVGLSRYFGEASVSIWADAPGAKLTSLLGLVRGVRPGINLLVIHLGAATPEMSALVDLNNQDDPYRAAVHRQAELDAVCSPAFRQAVAGAGIELITYRDIVERVGREKMSPPVELGSYSESFDEQ